MLRFILILSLGIMIGPGVWRIAQRYNPRATPSYVVRSVAAWSIAEIQHLSVKPNSPQAR